METAPRVLGDHVRAFLLDWCVVGLFVVFWVATGGAVATLLGSGPTAVVAEAGGRSIVAWHQLALGAVPGAVAYPVAFESRYGRTVGKATFDLVVVRTDGSPCTRRDAVVRLLLLPVDFLPAGFILGALSAGVSDRGQRLGDRAAGTTVVEHASPAEDGSVTLAYPERRPALETAGEVLHRRAAATLLDWGVIASIGFLLGLVPVAAADATGLSADTTLVAPAGVSLTLDLAVLAIFVVLPPVYHAVLETTLGRTVGKALVGLTVVRLDGSAPALRDAFGRTILRPVDFLPVGFLLGALSIVASDCGQRLGDRLVGTTVVAVDDEAGG